MPARKRIKNSRENKLSNGMIAAVVIFSVLAIIYFAKEEFFSADDQMISEAALRMPVMGRMSLSSYDRELARQMMDKNNDGK